MKLIVANWKLYLGVKEATVLAKRVSAAVPRPRAKVVICPSAPALFAVRGILGSAYALGAQDTGVAARGPHTGELSPKDLRELGCTYAIVGHSERRRLGESDALIRRKLEAALKASLTPILCVGETLAERRKGKARQVVRRQLISAFGKLKPGRGALVVAYEPVWAIGTGTPAKPRDAVIMHTFVRAEAKKLLPAGTPIRIIYGGSVDRKNIISFLGASVADGVLIGSASAKPSFIDMLKIVR